MTRRFLRFRSALAFGLLLAASCAALRATALFITVAALLAVVRFIHLPMERAIIEAQARSAESRKAAEAASDAKTQFLATMSHEIRTPMNGILGIAELMRTTSPSDDQRRLADVIHESGQSLMSIIDDILDLSKIEAGKVELERRPFDVAGVCDAVRRLFSSRAESKGLNLALDVDPNGRNWVRRGDEKAVRQIISNLVGNAIKFTESGTVTISLTDRTDDVAGDVSGGVSGEPVLVIAVRDEGIGVSPEAQSRIFEEFEQADASTTRNYGGAGLGLSIVRRLTEAMGGEIALKSALGQGAEFTVRLPLERVDEAAPEADGESAATAGAPILHKHVLIADDNDLNRTIAVRFLEKAGRRVSEVANGAEAVDMAERLEPDLIFMDGEMPLLDGIEATRAIREGERKRRKRPVPIIALSANAKPERRRRAIEAGMDGYVVKPFEADELLEVLATDWSERRGAAPKEDAI